MIPSTISGIFLHRKVLASLGKSGLVFTGGSKQDKVKQLAAEEIAFDTAAANEQHYEVPCPGIPGGPKIFMRGLGVEMRV